MATPYLTIVPAETARPVSDRAGTVAAILEDRDRVLRRALDRLRLDAAALGRAADLMVRAFHGGGKVLTAGNGGSAAEAQHLAAELVGRFKRERAALPALSLTADTAVLTAIANDYGYEAVFARQVEAWGVPGDVVVLFSTSGESPNVLAAAKAARARGLRVVAVTGGGGCALADAADVAIRAEAEETAVVQEVHVVVLHLLCDLVEAECRCAEGGLRP